MSRTRVMASILKVEEENQILQKNFDGPWLEERFFWQKKNAVKYYWGSCIIMSGVWRSLKKNEDFRPFLEWKVEWLPSFTLDVLGWGRSAEMLWKTWNQLEKAKMFSLLFMSRGTLLLRTGNEGCKGTRTCWIPAMKIDSDAHLDIINRQSWVRSWTVRRSWKVLEVNPYALNRGDRRPVIRQAWEMWNRSGWQYMLVPDMLTVTVCV